MGLMDFMKNNPEKATDGPESTERSSYRVASGSTRLQTQNLSTSGNKSKAQLDIEHLRFYTRWTSLEAAVEQQLVLANVQNRLAAASDADKEFWSKPRDVLRIFEDVLAQHGTCMSEFSLSVYVEMRAPEWVANCHHITSPILPLEEAVALRLRLLHARSTSWERLYEEWVKLLQGG